jgi:hypothetical protein
MQLIGPKITEGQRSSVKLGKRVLVAATVRVFTISLMRKSEAQLYGATAPISLFLDFTQQAVYRDPLACNAMV